jgi:hypothetical protein
MHDNADYDQLVVENRILGLQLRRVAERCERLEQELLWERVEALRRIREIVRAQEREEAS